MLYLILPLSLLAWFYVLYGGSGIYSNKSIAGGGGDPDPPAAPAPAPSPQETTEEAIQAQINSLPQILAAQQEYGPQFSEQQLQQFLTYGPQYAQASLDLSQQFGGAFAQQVRDEQDILDPSRGAGSDALAQYLLAGSSGLSPQEEAQIRADSRSATSARGLGESGFAAQDETASLLNARQALKSRYLNVALSAAGRLPGAGGATVGANPAAYGQQLVQNVTPSEIFGAQASNQAYNASIFNTQSQNYWNQQGSGSNMSGIGTAAGMAIGGLLAAPTGGMSIAAGAMLGGGFGGAFGSLLG